MKTTLFYALVLLAAVTLWNNPRPHKTTVRLSSSQCDSLPLWDNLHKSPPVIRLR